MWRILLFSSCLASLKFSVADDISHGQQASEHLETRYSPRLRTPQSSLEYPSFNFGENKFQEPLIYKIINPQSERQQPSSAICPQLETLQTVLTLLKRLMNQNDAYVVQPDKRVQILQALKEYLERADVRVNEIDNQQKLEELLNIANHAALSENVINKNDNNHIKTKFIFKYEIPHVNNVDCKEALASLIQIVKNAYMQMMTYCNQIGKCSLQTDSAGLYGQNNDIDVSDILKSSPHFDNTVQIQKQIQSSNQNSLNIHNLKSMNNLLKSHNQLLNQMGSNDYVNTHIFPDSYLNGYKYPFVGSVNSAIDKAVSNQDRNKVISHHLYSNKHEQQTNILQSDESNNLKSRLYSQIPAQVQITPSIRYPFNMYSNQNPVNFPQNRKEYNVFLHSQAHLEPNLNVGQFLTTDHFNKGFVNSQFLNSQRQNLDFSNNNYLMEFDNNSKVFNDRIIYNNPTTNGFIELNRKNYALPAQKLDVKRNFLEDYNNEFNKQMSYNKLLKLSGGVEDKSSSAATINQNKENINEQAQYDRTVHIPDNRFSYLSFGRANGIQKIGHENLLKSNLDHHFSTIQNNFKRQYKNSNVDKKLYYNSQQADAFKSSLGFNPYASTISVQRDLNDNKRNPLDLFSFASMPHSVKLTSPDNYGIVELTYKLKRPESTLRDTYYYAKFRMPYKNYLAKMLDVSMNPDLRSNPLKVHEELLALSNLAERSKDLGNIEPDEVVKLVLENGGELMNAKVLGANDSNANKYLETIQDLNGNLNTNDVLKLFENYKNYKTYTPIDSDIPIHRPEPYPYETGVQFPNGGLQYYFEVEPRRLFAPIVQYDTKMVRIPFQPEDLSKTYSIPEKYYVPNAAVY